MMLGNFAIWQRIKLEGAFALTLQSLPLRIDSSLGFRLASVRRDAIEHLWKAERALQGLDEGGCMETEGRLARSQEVGAKLVGVFNKRMQVANDYEFLQVIQALSRVCTSTPRPFPTAARTRKEQYDCEA